MRQVKAIMMAEISRDTKALRSFGLIVGGLFALIGWWPALVRGDDLRLWALILAGLLLIPAILYPRCLAPVHRIWMAIGHVMGWVNTRVVLTVVFYGIFAPIGLAMRLLGKAPIRHKFEPGAATYRVGRQARPSSHMRHQF